jgi:hypothetical protein
VLARKPAEAVEGHVQRIAADRDGERHSEQQQGDAERFSGKPVVMDSGLGLPAAPE